MSDSISVTITVKIGNQTVRLTDAAPIKMSGDRRRHRRQIRERIEEQAEFMSSRFGVTGS